MLEAHERAERSRELETVPRLAAVPDWSSAHAPGATVGPFELVRPLGHGGMGEVWLARQADGRVEREVALKLPALYQQGEVWRERFRRERDILAKLEHPHIARLYDAGVTEAGQPWLAMEFVEGLTLSEHVASRSLGIAERLALFRQVLAAVAHAHRHLVVHRDLKPANILIDTSGQVKLLDFGIAKLVDEAESAQASGELTRLGGRVMTLRYAAPEQVAAGTITTATDIYALGVILHELVTGLSPYRAVREGKPLTDVMLLQEEIAVPSALALPRPLARQVAGDLDAIVLKALRRDPAARYASVELFDEDILAHLERRPVKARAGTWRYLAGRFAIRHKLPLAMAAAVAGDPARGSRGGRAGATRGRGRKRARRAPLREREEARQHVHLRRAREDREPARLARGARDAREDLARVPRRPRGRSGTRSGVDLRDRGRVPQHRQYPGAGRAPRTRATSPPRSRNFEKSKALFRELERGNANDIAIAREHRKLSYALARGYYLILDPRWRPEIDETVRLSERIGAAPGATPDDRSLLPLARIERASLESIVSGRTPEAEAVMTRAVAALEALARETPGEPDARANLASAYLRIAKLLYHAGRTAQSAQEAVAYMLKARALQAQLRAEFPADARMLARELEAVTELGRAQGAAGDLRGADRTMDEALALSREAVARDPSNASLAMDHVNILGAACDSAMLIGDQARAIRLCREALALAGKLPEQARKSWDVRIYVSNAKGALGYALVHSAGPAAGGRERRLAMLLEARALLADVGAFIGAAKEQKLGAVPESYLKVFGETVKRCDEEIAKLEAA